MFGVQRTKSTNFYKFDLTGFERKEQIEKLSYVKKLGRNLVCKNTVVIVIN